MSNSQQMKKGLSVRDLITTGILAALYMVCAMIGEAIFGFFPVLTFLCPLSIALLCGPVYMLIWPPVRKHPHLQHRCNRVVPKLLEICCFQSYRLKQQPCVPVSACRFDVPLRQRDSGQLYYVSVYGACHADSVGNCF